MSILKILIFSALLVLIPALSRAFEGAAGCGSMDCASCHTLSMEDAEKILEKVRIRVTEVQESPVKGVWQITGYQNDKKIVAYMDFGKKFILDIRQFIPLESLGKPPALKKLDLSQISLSGTVLLGDKNAKNKIIVFDDPDCPYCRKLHKDIKLILGERKDIAFYIKLYPLEMHPAAYEKSKTILCENSTQLLDDAFEGKTLPEAKCNPKALDENIKEAKRLGITGTPAIILPDGRLIGGYVESKVLLDLLDNPQ